MQGFNVAPICGYLAGPQDLGTIQERTKGFEKVKVELKQKEPGHGLKRLYTQKDGKGFPNIVGKEHTSPLGTSITIGKTTCFSPKDKNGKITKCMTQIQGGTELIQDETGTRVQQSGYQKMFSNWAVLVNAASENEVFTSASK